MSILRPGDRLLFQGDSITDAGRREEKDPYAFGLGKGYAAMIAGLVQARQPSLRLDIINRGISGNRTEELLDRWQVDCIDLKPQVVSIKIGVNDVWRKFQPGSAQRHIPLDEYRANLVKLLEQTRAGGAREVILISPTTIDRDNDHDSNRLLGDYAACCRELAAQCKGHYVEVRTPLMAARKARPDIVWAPDGCHPAPAGHALIAEVWYKQVIGS